MMKTMIFLSTDFTTISKSKFAYEKVEHKQSINKSILNFSEGVAMKCCSYKCSG